MTEVEIRPPWWRVAVGVVGGVNAGGLLFLVVEAALRFLAYHLFGQQDWGKFRSPEDLLYITSTYLRWIIVIGLGLYFSVGFSGWNKTVIPAAALQTFWLIVLYPLATFAPLWLVPTGLAFVCLRMEWPRALATKVRAAWPVKT